MFGVLDSQPKLQSLAYPKVWVLYMLHVSVSERLLAFVPARKAIGSACSISKTLVSAFQTHVRQAFYYRFICFLVHFKC